MKYSNDTLQKVMSRLQKKFDRTQLALTKKRATARTGVRRALQARYNGKGEEVHSPSDYEALPHLMTAIRLTNEMDKIRVVAICLGLRPPGQEVDDPTPKSGPEPKKVR